MTRSATILIVEDDQHIRRLLQGALSRAGYHIIEAATARDAVASLKADPQLILLDLGLPDREGMELLPVIARQSKAPVLIVSAREATEEKVTALDLGAVDFVTKPFDTDELLARIRAALRTVLAADGGRSSVTIGAIQIDLLNHRVTRDAEEVHLTPKEFAVLAELARFPGRAITHRQLLSAVWANDYDQHIEYLRVVVRNMRQKLEPDPARPSIIVNELGVGYRLMGSDG
ncbi:response regulator transcription factor [Sphingobium aquiterrae]|uniref:response regulator transcription factor n=1 Tax=Sphingobium aquiterrae TaxID=2038656 RepID=UPI003016C18A